jgi:hypothetical protein
MAKASAFVGFKAPKPVHDRLNELERLTGQTKSTLLRYLILTCELGDFPAVWTQLSGDERQLLTLVGGR